MKKSNKIDNSWEWLHTKRFCQLKGNIIQEKEKTENRGTGYY